MLDQQPIDDFKLGVATAKAGNPQMAKRHFQRALESVDGKNSADAWMWLAWLADSPDVAVHSLERAVAIAPNHKIAHTALLWAQHMAQYQPSLTTPLTKHAAPNSQLTPPHQTQVDDSLEAINQHQEPRSEQNCGASFSESPGFAAWRQTIAEPEISADHLTPSATCDWISQQLDEPEPSVGPTERIAFAARGFATEQQAQPTPIEPPNRSSDPVPTSADSWMEVAANVQSPSIDASENTEKSPQAIVNWRDQLRHQTQKRKADRQLEPEDELVESVDEITSFMSPPTQSLQPRSLSANAEPTTSGENESGSIHTISRFDESLRAPSNDAATDTAVLIVDDSPTVRKLVSLTLERHGYRVIAACDGVAAIHEMAAHTPKLVLLDINMPRLDGYKLCKLIKKHGTTRDIPVVMLAGKDGMFDRLRGRLVGCSDYLTKPFDSETLLAKVADYLPPETIVEVGKSAAGSE